MNFAVRSVSYTHLGGYDGDLLLKVKVGMKAGFERKEMDVYTKAMIPFTTAVLGGEVVVPTLYGKVLCTCLLYTSRCV